MSTAIPIPTPSNHRSSQEWWSLDNGGGEVSLHQFGWSVATVGGNRYDLPPKRGDNRKFPYRPGTRHQRKLPDERTVSLDMWLTAMKPGTGAIDGDMVLRWNDSWNFIRELVWNYSGDQITLTRRWWQTIDGVAVLQKASALVEIADTMPPTMTSRFSATFSMTLLMADPFYYGDWVTHRIDSGSSLTIFNPGQDKAMYENFEVELRGPLSNVTLTNTSFSPDIWVKYTGSITGGVTLNVPDFLALDSAGSNQIRFIQHAGAQFWMGLKPKNNVLTLSSSGGGYANIHYRPKYI